jgi:hypothetical protein
MTSDEKDGARHDSCEHSRQTNEGKEVDFMRGRRARQVGSAGIVLIWRWVSEFEIVSVLFWQGYDEATIVGDAP